MVHFRQAELLGITLDDTIFELDVTRVPAVLVAEHTHEGGPAARVKRLDYRRVRRIEPAVGIGHEKFRSKTVDSAANRATGAEQRWPVDNVIDLHAESAAVANKELYLLPAVADQQLDVSDAFPSKKPQLMRDKRFAGDFEERFW